MLQIRKDQKPFPHIKAGKRLSYMHENPVSPKAKPYISAILPAKGKPSESETCVREGARMPQETFRQRNLLNTGGIHVSLSEDARLKKAGNMALPVHTFRCRKGLMSAGRRALLVKI